MDLIDEYVAKAIKNKQVESVYKSQKELKKWILRDHYYYVDQIVNEFCDCASHIKDYDLLEKFLDYIYQATFNRFGGCKDLIFKTVMQAVMDNPWIADNFDENFFTRIYDKYTKPK